MATRVTQKEIARRLNLSQSLVAGVLNNRPGVWVSQENRERILKLARELNYRPNAAARALRRGRTELVACVFFGEAGYNPVVEPLADVLAEKGYDLLVKVVPSQEQAAQQLTKLMAPGACDAVLLWGNEHDVEPFALQLADVGVPFVVKGRFETEHPTWLQADFDHEAMMRQAMEVLKSHGHTRIAFLGYNNGLVYAQKLLSGYHQAFRELFGETAPAEFVGFVAVNEPEEVSSEKHIERWLQMPVGRRPTAAVAAAGRATWHGVEMALARHGLRLGLDSGSFGMAGQMGVDIALLFGEGYAYLDVDFITLTRALATQLLLPLVERKMVQQKILRLIPQLRLTPTLRLSPLPQPTPLFNSP